MSKMTEKEDSLAHIQHHIDKAAARATTASARASQVVNERLDPEVLLLGCQSVVDEMKDAIQHIRAYKP